MAFTIARHKGIGGSDVAALCGLDRRKSAYQLWMEKRGLLPESLMREENERMLFGKLLERPIGQEFARRTGRRIARQRRTLRAPDARHQLANIDYWEFLDGRADPKGVLECKNVDSSRRRDWTTGGVPDRYYLQLQHYLMVTGCGYGSFAVLFGGNQLVYFDVERDEATVFRLRALEADFWRRVRTGEAPDFSYDEAGAELIQHIYSTATAGKSVTLDAPDAQAKVARLLAVKAQIKAREAVKVELETWLKYQMRDAEKALVPGIARISWASSSRQSLDVEALRRAHPGLVAQFQVEQSQRRFLVMPYKEFEVAADDGVADDAPITVTTGVRQIQLD